MYQISTDGYILYDPRLDDYIVGSPKLNLASNSAGSFSCTVFNGHPSYNHLHKKSSIIQVNESGNTIFRGRVISTKKDFRNNLVVKAEGVLAYLNDSYYHPFNFPDDYPEATEASNIIEYLLQDIIDNHNEQVETYQQFTLGSVTVTDPNNYINRSSEDYLSSWEIISQKLIKSLGGYIVIRYEQDGNYIDYVSDLPLTNTQEVRFGENLVDLSQSSDGTDSCSVILPLGKDGLTIAEHPDGSLGSNPVEQGVYIYDTVAVNNYGWVVKKVNWDDVTETNNLVTKASSWLNGTGVMFADKIEVTALDLHCTDDEIASFRINRKVRCYSEPHNVTQTYNLEKLEIDLLNPQNTKIKLGKTVYSLVDFTREETTQQIRESRKESSAYVNALRNETIERISGAIQTSEAFTQSVLTAYTLLTDFMQFQQTTQSNFTQTSEDITASFNTLQNTITDVNGDLQSKIDEIKTYFRFTQDGLFIGKSTSPIVLKIINDRISFLSGGDSGIEVAYWSENKFIVRDSKFLSTMQIGGFGFFPRENGSLTFKKVN